ncbi:hypothetical protein DFH28DRAFT_942328 [Melampsora americana]|nr:hypothetical protein DFH28DRAFT_942328 [Melampsora americana]
MIPKIIISLYIISKIVPSILSLPYEGNIRQPLLATSSCFSDDISESLDSLLIEDDTSSIMAGTGTKRRSSQEPINKKSKVLKQEPEIIPSSSQTWKIYCRIASNVFMDWTASPRGPQLAEFVNAVLALGVDFDKNSHHSIDITLKRRKVINLATTLLDDQELFGAPRLWIIGILSYLKPNGEANNNISYRTAVDRLIPLRANLELEIFHGPQLANFIQKVYTDRDTISQEAMWEGIARASTLISIKTYLKTYRDPNLDSIGNLISEFIKLGTPLRKKEVSSLSEKIFLFIEMAMMQGQTHMQKIGFYLLLHIERYDGLSRVKIKEFVQKLDAYASTFRGVYRYDLNKKVPEQIETTLWIMNANKEIEKRHIDIIMDALLPAEFDITFATKGKLFRILNLTCILNPKVRDLVNERLDEKPEDIKPLFQVLRTFYTNLEPKNDIPKDLKDEIEEKGLRLSMPELRRPLEAKLIPIGIDAEVVEGLSKLETMDVDRRETHLANLTMRIFMSLKISQEKSFKIIASDPRIEYILHLIAIKNNDKNLSLCLYSKDEPVFRTLLLTVYRSISDHTFIEFNDFLLDLETKINFILTSLILG